LLDFLERELSPQDDKFALHYYARLPRAHHNKGRSALHQTAQSPSPKSKVQTHGICIQCICDPHDQAPHGRFGLSVARDTLGPRQGCHAITIGVQKSESKIDETSPNMVIVTSYLARSIMLSCQKRCKRVISALSCPVLSCLVLFCFVWEKPRCRRRRQAGAIRLSAGRLSSVSGVGVVRRRCVIYDDTSWLGRGVYSSAVLGGWKRPLLRVPIDNVVVGQNWSLDR